LYLAYLGMGQADPELAHRTPWMGDAPFPFVFPTHLLHGTRPFWLRPAVMALVPAGIAAAIWRRRSAVTLPRQEGRPGGWMQATLWTLAGALLSLNRAVLSPLGIFRAPLDYAISWVPSLVAIRMPSRLGVAALIGLGMLSGMAFGEITALLRTTLRR